jgi:hypothetical protein
MVLFYTLCKSDMWTCLFVRRGECDDPVITYICVFEYLAHVHIARSFYASKSSPFLTKVTCHCSWYPIKVVCLSHVLIYTLIGPKLVLLGCNRPKLVKHPPFSLWLLWRSVTGRVTSQVM